MPAKYALTSFSGSTMPEIAFIVRSIISSSSRHGLRPLSMRSSIRHSLVLRAGEMNFRDGGFDLRAIALERRRKHQLRAQLRRRLIGSETGSIGCDFEQHAAGLAIINRVK